MGEIVRVIIDAEACLHHGCCRDACPEVFALPASGDARNAAFVKPGAEERFSEDDLRIRLAVAACPMDAIRLEERAEA